MTRKEFLKKVGLLMGWTLVPGAVAAQVKHYDKYYLLQCFVRGFRYYEGPKLLDVLKEGDELELVREPQNEYDTCAVALHWNGKKIGFIPAESNELLSRLLDIGLPDLAAEVTFLKKEAATWENVSIAVYVLKERTGDAPLVDAAAYLTTLNTPAYYSLKRNDNIITRLYKSEEQRSQSLERQEEEWIASLGKPGDRMSDDRQRQARFGVADKAFAVRREQLPLTKIPDEAIRNMDNWMKQSDVLFADDGYIALSFEEAEDLVSNITDLKVQDDLSGRSFIELMLK